MICFNSFRSGTRQTSDHMKNCRLVTLSLTVLALCFGTTAMSADSGSGVATRKTGTSGASKLIRAAAEVVAINPATRTLILKREDGNTVTVLASPRVGSLEHVHVGDIVVAQYGHARAISLKRTAALASESGTPAVTPQKATTSVPPGRVRRELVADIIAIDDRTGEATLKGQNGEVVDVVVGNRKLLAAVRIGDRVRLEYTDAVAMAIKPAGKAISPKRQASQ